MSQCAEILVITPQDIALLDVMKGIEMFGKLKVLVLSIFKNIRLHICSNCN
ncbi:MAG: P-loop NTPase [Arsenophonus sp.]